jgi:EAL domain-containing protein (putative c-di-GMP-specific phosphodiesterase class I)
MFVSTSVSTSIAVLRIYFLHEESMERLQQSTLSDTVLRAIALRLKAFAQRVDSGHSTAESWGARLGNQEFALVLTNILVTEDVLSFLKELVADLQVPYDLEYQSKRLLVKVGAAIYPDHGKTASQLLSHAEIAVHHCLLEEQTSYCLYISEMKEVYAARQRLLTDLPFALERNEFYLVYQPQVHWATERIIGVEALLRWNHPELGDIPPSQFISLAEDAQLLSVLGKWVIERACRQMQEWRSLTLLPLQMSINIWPQQLQDTDFLDHILRCLRVTGLNADQLVLDISEPCLMALEVGEVSRLLRELANIGIQIAIDSFGMHSMPLQNLKRLPINILKLDKSFVDHIVDDKRDAIITEAIIAMAQSLKLKVLAKGIETEEQLTVITKYGCHVMQGYLYSPPLPPDELKTLLTVGNADVVG